MLKFKEKYQKEVVPAMMAKFGYKSKMAVPKVEKVVINSGFGRLVTGKTSEEQKNICNSISEGLSSISGQKSVAKKAKKSIASFKTREGMIIGAAVTLRKSKMYDFLDKLIHVALPRSRDFQGIDPKSFDERGNLTIGIKEHIIFPEILPERAKNIFGLEVVVATTAKSKEEGMELLKFLGFPIKK